MGRHLATAVAAGLTLTASLTLAACGGGGDGGEDDGVSTLSTHYSVVGALEALPSTSEKGKGPLTVVSGDLGKATKLAGVDKPTSVQERGQWAADLGNKGPVYVPFPQNLGVDNLATDQFRDVLGFDATDVSTFAAIETPPRSFTVVRLDGGHLKKGVTKTGKSNVGTVDSESLSTQGSGPFLLTLGVGEKGGAVALSQTTSALSAWKKGGRSMADHAALRDIAGALDSKHVYAAELITKAMKPSSIPPEALDKIKLRMPAFDAVGIGQAVHNGDEVEYVAYRVDDPGKAKSTIEKVWRDGDSLLQQRPLSSLADVADVSTHGKVVVVELRPTSLALAMRMAQQVDLPFADLS